MDAVRATEAGHRPDLPLSIGFALWAEAWLRGAVSLDDAHDAIAGPELVHLLTGLPGVADSEPLILGLGRLRGLGAQGARVCLPVPGDPVGLAGPPAFNREALGHGGAVLLSGTAWGLLPVRLGASVVWTAAPARTDGPLLDPGEADRELRAGLSAAATDLADSYFEAMGPVISLGVVQMGLTVPEAIYAATKGGAISLGLFDRGVIEPGMRADLIVLDAPSADHIPYRPATNLVTTTISGGMRLQ